jgi:thiol-disulfide isomerase/thioredoxin
MEVQITTDNFESYKNGNLPLVVDFWATWCASLPHDCAYHRRTCQ